MANWGEYTWLVVVGSLMAFFMAFGIGANDVANAMATSVGSKTLTLSQATVLAAVFELLGALLLGRGVTKTIRKGILDLEFYVHEPEVLAFGMLCALTAAALWLLMATYWELPVSTTHSIIGGLVGFSLVAHGSDSVIWNRVDTSREFPIKGISAVVISWVFSPVASGLIAMSMFWVTRTFILRSPDSYTRAFNLLPFLAMICVFINAFYVMDKGITKLNKSMETKDSAAYAGVSAMGAFALACIGVYLGRRAPEAHQPKGSDAGVGMKNPEAPTAVGESEENRIVRLGQRVSRMIDYNDPHAAVIGDSDVARVHGNAESFEDETEGVFRWLQVLTSCCDAFAHGANDVSNASAPLAAIYAVYRQGSDTVNEVSHVPIWVLMVAGAGLVLGLAVYGYRIIKAIGIKMTKITPSRGYCIELGSSLVVVTGSYLGLPLSTTHCQVGATVAVGLIEGPRNVSWSIIGKSVVGWIITLLVVGALSAMFMALGIYSPNIRASSHLRELRTQTHDLSSIIVDLMVNVPCDQIKPEDYQTMRDVIDGATKDNVLRPEDVRDVLRYMATLHTEAIDICPKNSRYRPIAEVFPELTERYTSQESENAS